MRHVIFTMMGFLAAPTAFLSAYYVGSVQAPLAMQVLVIMSLGVAALPGLAFTWRRTVPVIKWSIHDTIRFWRHRKPEAKWYLAIQLFVHAIKENYHTYDGGWERER